jgi:hypothetical protein
VYFRVGNMASVTLWNTQYTQSTSVLLRPHHTCDKSTEGRSLCNFPLLKITISVVLGVHVTFTKVLTISHSQIHPAIILLHPPPPFLDSFTRSHFSIFIHEYIIFHHIHPPTPFPYILSPPTGTNPQTDLVLPSCKTLLYL